MKLTVLMVTCALLSVLGGAALGCRGQTSAEPPILPLRNMADQDRYDPQSASKFFADGRTMRIGGSPASRVRWRWRTSS